MCDGADFVLAKRYEGVAYSGTRKIQSTNSSKGEIGSGEI